MLSRGYCIFLWVLLNNTYNNTYIILKYIEQYVLNKEYIYIYIYICINIVKIMLSHIIKAL